MERDIVTNKCGIVIGGIFLVLLVLSIFFIWRFLFLQRSIVASATTFQCISYDPRYSITGNVENKVFFIDEKQIREDLRVISKFSPCIRTYRSTRGMEAVPRIAKEFNMEVIGGAWIEGKNEVADQDEVDTIIRTANEYKNVKMIFLGNETMQFKRIPEQKLIEYIIKAKTGTSVPVGTSESIKEWNNYPKILKTVDVIGLHALPYWASVHIDEAVDWVFGQYRQIKNIAEGKPVIISETGWPSLGAQWGRSVPSLVNEARFIRELSVRAEKESVQYNIFEAIDQPWKIYDEGRAGAHWGIFDPNKNLKFLLSGSVTNDQYWMYWALGTIFIIVIIGTIFLYFFRDLSPLGLVFGISVVAISTILSTIIIQTAISEYMTRRPFLWFFVIPTQFFLIFITAIQTIEVVEVIGKRKLKRILPFFPQKNIPKVSIHIPTRDENPESVIRAIKSLLSLEYSNKEIVVIENNTKDELLWKPISEFSKQYPEIVKFFHLDSCSGFKAGALNFGLSQTAPDAEIIGIIDADYVVSPDWLTKTVGYFTDPTIAVVQAPQAHTIKQSDAFGKFIQYEYGGFFEIGMVQRNEKNALIQHGTMTLIRKDVLKKIGAWSEWSITEDAELGVRILFDGYVMYYVHETLGHGEPAETFSAYKQQRFRWVYGAVRIIIRHWKRLFGIHSVFTPAQIFYFTGGWIVWGAQGLYPLFILFGITGSALVIFDQRFFPPSQFLYPSLFYFVFLVCSIFLVYRERVTKNIFLIVTAMISGAALVPTISRAIWDGFLSGKKPFVRTRTKEKDPTSRRYAYQLFLKNSWTHILIAGWFSASTIILMYTYGTWHRDAFFWAIILIVLSIPSFCVIVISLVDSLSHRKKAL